MRRRSSARSRSSASTSSSASRAARSCRRTTRSSTRPACGTSWSATSRAPGTPRPGYAQATGRVGVCIATSGPGATNLVTPIADAYMDSVPIVAITGQVGRPLDRHRRLPGGRHLRHHAADHQAQLPGHSRPTTSRGSIAEAFHIASTGRPGPVLVDIPKDVLQAQTTFSWPPTLDLPGYRPVTPAARQADPRGGPADRAGPAAGALRRRRRAQGPRRATSCARSPS